MPKGSVRIRAPQRDIEVRDAYRRIFDVHPQPMWVFDTVTLAFLEVNRAATELYGYSREAFLSMTIADIRPPEDRQFLRSFVRNLESTRATRSMIWRHVTAAGRVFHVDVTSSPVEFDGRPARIVVAIDATARIAVADALTRSRTALAEAQELAHLGSWDQDLEKGDIRWSPELFRILGLDPVCDEARLLWEFDHPADAESVREEVFRARSERRLWNIDHRVVRPNGEIRFVQERGRLEYGDDGRPRRIVGAMLDITDRKIAEQRLRYIAEHDTLSGLPNRAHVTRRLSEALGTAQARGRTVAVLLLNLDRFKAVNDAIGHDAGDSLIVELARRLRALPGDIDLVARPGADEFMIVLDDLQTGHDADALCARILELVAMPLAFNETRIVVTGSIGVALFPRDGATAEDLLRCADSAMYAAKRRGGNSFEHFRPELHRLVVEELNLERALRFALDREAIELAYQPIVSARTKRTVALEALARWTENGCAVDPASFIRLAEQTGQIARLGQFVLERACHDMRRLIDLGHGQLSMAVNISAGQFRQPRFVESVRETLEATGLAAANLVLEITESAYIGADTALEAMRELRALGIRLAIDDFGTGFSALGYLKRLPVDAIKIDRSFVEHVTTDVADEAIVRAIVSVARNLDLVVVAEGVETGEQAALLESRGCTRLQGFHFSRPLAAEALQIYLGETMRA